MGKRKQRGLAQMQRHGKGKPWQGCGLLPLEDVSIDRETALSQVVAGVEAATREREEGGVPFSPEALKPVQALVVLFDFTPEDLLEAGMAYETVCAMEKALLW
jgi:hypothetical protein